MFTSFLKRETETFFCRTICQCSSRLFLFLSEEASGLSSPLILPGL